MPNEFQQRADELIDAGRLLYRLGMVPATSGNFSARLADNSLAITVSGTHKGHLQRADIMQADATGNSLDGNTPSAETLLHIQLYTRFPNTRAILHPHSVNATLLSLLTDDVVLHGYELLKAFPGISTHEQALSVPVFANDQDIGRLAAAVEAHMAGSDADIHGYLIRGHGFYTWGGSVDEALKHAEAFEFLFDCELRRQGVSRQ